MHRPVVEGQITALGPRLRVERRTVRGIDFPADRAEAVDQRRNDGAAHGHRVLVPAFERRLGQVAAAEDGFAGFRHLNFDMLTAPQRALRPAFGYVAPHLPAGRLERHEVGRQRRSLCGGHQDTAKPLAKSVDQQLHAHPTTLGREQGGQEGPAVAVVLDVESGEGEKRPGGLDHVEAARPFRRPVPERYQSGRRRHQSL
ncbi:MAG: hypothetical protein IPP09_03870 [Elusimicrobia bacterium]|nr:hypothetical protein [Elusimicrobiota bacterium]